MISEEQALDTILKAVAPLSGRQVSLQAADNSFAAGDLFARLPLPRFDNSMMDGYAVVASACHERQRLRVVGEQPAAVDRYLVVRSGEAIRVFTGAPIPSGADAVIMQEEVHVDGNDIVITSGVEAGENIRCRGCDLAEGQKILSAGDRLRPQNLALLAAQGFVDVKIGCSARVCIVSTGDELVAPGAKLEDGQTYESNSVLLRALVSRCGAELTAVHHCPDDFERLKAMLALGLENDVLIVSGGVSVGDRDLVKPVLRDLGANIDLWRVAIKPGKPFLFGRRNGCLIFGLPGNPVSAYVTFLQLVRPALLKVMGAADRELPLPRCRARLATPLTNDGSRPHYVRGRLAQGQFTPVGRQESHALFGLSQANSLLRVAPGAMISAGEIVDVQMGG
jgi:molybdopterin molybdotransferase